MKKHPRARTDAPRAPGRVSNSVSLAIFDLDNTLIGGDSDHAWGEFLIAQGLVDERSYRRANDGFYHDYQRGELDIEAYLRFALAPLTRYSHAQLQTLHQQFMREVIATLQLPKAQQLLQTHRERGDFLLIITATNAFITAPIAASLGVDALLASEAEIVDGRYTGEPRGIPCFQHGKVERLQQWLRDSDHNLAGSSFYSDSHNDLPLLELVEHPVAVDPDPTLEQIAASRGWPIISLR